MLSKPLIRGMVAAILLSLAGTARADAPTNHYFAARAEKALLEAQKQYQSTNSATNTLRFARACFDLAELATNETQRAKIARHGIDACRRLLARQSNSAPAHYYLAMNLGELAQAEAPSLAAYKLVHEVEHEFLTAAALDVRFDHAGPARSLGKLYFQAPGWPFSIGSSHKAREWFERAVALAPEYPGNLLDLAEAQLKWRQHAELDATLIKMEAIWPVARTNLTGESWEECWSDWEPRRAALKAEYQRIYGPKH